MSLITRKTMRGEDERSSSPIRKTVRGEDEPSSSPILKMENLKKLWTRKI